jgi:hypothetical protein
VCFDIPGREQQSCPGGRLSGTSPALLSSGQSEMLPEGAKTMPDRHGGPTTNPDAQPVPTPDAEGGTDPMPLPGAAGPIGGSPTGELVDGVNQPVELPGERPPLATDQ